MCLCWEKETPAAFCVLQWKRFVFVFATLKQNDFDCEIFVIAFQTGHKLYKQFGMAAILRLKAHVVPTSGPNDKLLCTSFLDSSQLCGKICGEIGSLHKTVYLQNVVHMSAGGSAKNQPRQLAGIPMIPMFWTCPEKVPLT